MKVHVRIDRSFCVWTVVNGDLSILFKECFTRTHDISGGDFTNPIFY